MEIAEGTSAMHNEPALTRRISAALARSCGQFNVEEANPMGAEDFSEFGKRYEDSIKNGTPLPSLHSSEIRSESEADDPNGRRTTDRRGSLESKG